MNQIRDRGGLTDNDDDDDESDDDDEVESSKMCVESLRNGEQWG